MPQNQTDSLCSFNGDSGVEFFPSWIFSTRSLLWWWAYFFSAKLTVTREKLQTFFDNESTKQKTNSARL